MKRILVTGVPGVGKTEISKNLFIDYEIVNDKAFCVEKDLGYFETTLNQEEYVVDISKLNKAFREKIKENKNNIVFEGHLWVELSKHNLKYFDVIIILETKREILEKRMRARNYPEIKIEENIFCQETNYIDTLFDKKKINFKKIKIGEDLKKNILKIKMELKNG